MPYVGMVDILDLGEMKLREVGPIWIRLPSKIPLWLQNVLPRASQSAIAAADDCALTILRIPLRWRCSLSPALTHCRKATRSFARILLPMVPLRHRRSPPLPSRPLLLHLEQSILRRVDRPTTPFFQMAGPIFALPIRLRGLRPSSSRPIQCPPHWSRCPLPRIASLWC